LFAARVAGPAPSHAPVSARLAAVPAAVATDVPPAAASAPAGNGGDPDSTFGLLAVGPPTGLGDRARWAVAFADCTEDELERLAATATTAS
jgi:hypothetical protein